MKVIKDFKHLESYTKIIKDKLISELWEMIYKPMFKICGSGNLSKLIPATAKAKNADNPIIEALDKGLIFYENGGFKLREKIPNRVSQALIKLGARYDRWEKSYKIAIEDLPKEIWESIKLSIQKAQQKLSQINQFLQYVEMNLDQIIETMLFHNEIITVLDDVGNKIQKNVQRVNILDFDFTQEQKEEIARNYTNNMQFYIKDWALKKIPEMRRKVQQAVLEGYREIDVQKMLENEYGIMERKAKFLAQNETSIMLAQIKKVHYSAMGFDSFMWHTILDARERPLHRLLNGTIHRFDNPPVIDERTGQRGLPGETYNCRCDLTPIMSDSAFYNTNQNAAREELKQYDKVMTSV